MSIGLLFPGQASQFTGMGKDLYDTYPEAREVFDEVSHALGMDVADLCFRGTDEDLKRTENTQPAIFTVSVAAFRAFTKITGIRPMYAAGHSLGEYSALVAAGVLPLAGAARILRLRAKYMQEAVPVGEGAMAAVIGLSEEAVASACRAAQDLGVVEPANFNGGGQIAISGVTLAVHAAGEEAKKAGAKRVIPLPVSAPFHCTLMKPAAERLAPELSALPQGRFRFPVVANVTAEGYPEDAGTADLLVRQITAPVRWEESVRRMKAMGVGRFVEVGPGKVLSGLVRRIEKDTPVMAFGAPGDLAGAEALFA